MNCKFTYQPHIQEVTNIRKDLIILEQEWRLPESEVRQILMIIEELFSNIVRFAFEDKPKYPVDIRLGMLDSQIEIEIIDEGIPFNPLEYQTGQIEDPASFDAGGMGLTLIRAFSSKVSYERYEGKNHLKITKTVKGR